VNTAAAIATPELKHGPSLSRGPVGMAGLIIAESCIFSIFIVAYLYYLGKSLSGPTPREVLSVPVVNTICLLSSSVTISFAVRALSRGRNLQFGSWWFATIVLGGYFLFGTGREWARLIYEKGLTIGTNLFGTTFYSLVGLHASHVIVGLGALLIVLTLSLCGLVHAVHAKRIEVVAIYWHFVDAIWVVVFTVGYVIGR